jgi:hypothetical protein
LAIALVVVPATILLPASDVLRDDQIRCRSDARINGGLEQTRSQGDGRSTAMTRKKQKAERSSQGE